MDLKISTALYRNELLRWAADNSIAYTEENDEYSSECLILVNQNALTTKLLCGLLEDLILISNDVVKSGVNIKSRLKKIVFATHEKDITRDIEGFLKENNSINLDGFLSFRLKKYKDIVDMILYAAIKKVLK
jgi:hypothetical protein